MRHFDHIKCKSEYENDLYDKVDGMLESIYNAHRYVRIEGITETHSGILIFYSYDDNFSFCDSDRRDEE